MDQQNQLWNGAFLIRDDKLCVWGLIKGETADSRDFEYNENPKNPGSKMEVQVVR